MSVTNTFVHTTTDNYDIACATVDALMAQMPEHKTYAVTETRHLPDELRPHTTDRYAVICQERTSR